MVLQDKRDKKILPMKNPIIKSYPYHSDLLSVVSNIEDYSDWFFNNYIQINLPKHIDKDGLRLDFFSSLMWETCPYLYYQRLSRDFVSKKWSSIIDFIIDSIDLGFYLHFNINRFYIPLYDQFKKRHSIHDIFIFGYDYNKKVFNVADNFKNGFYSYEKTTFDQIETGFNSINSTKYYDWLNGIELIRLKDNNRSYGFDHVYIFDAELVKNHLEDYLNSEVTAIKWFKIPSEQWKYGKDYYGIEIYNKLINYLDPKNIKQIGFDIRPFFVLWEHKKVMLLRIKYMGDNGYLNNADIIYDDYEEVENNAEILKNLWIKYSLSDNDKILTKMTNIIHDIIKKERNVIETMILNIR